MSNADTKFTTVEGRITACNLFVRDVFVDERGNEGPPLYNVEIAFDPADVQFQAEDGADLSAEDHFINMAVATWGEGAEDDYLNDRIRSPFLDGDQLAADREARGKKGDAYKGKVILRAKTKFNSNGDDSEGGINVHKPDNSIYDFSDQAEVYPGMMGRIAITIGTYKENAGAKRNALNLYLVSVQKLGDGERLFTAAATEDNFGAVKGSETKTRQRKRG